MIRIRSCFLNAKKKEKKKKNVHRKVVVARCMVDTALSGSIFLCSMIFINLIPAGEKTVKHHW